MDRKRAFAVAVMAAGGVVFGPVSAASASSACGSGGVLSTASSIETCAYTTPGGYTYTVPAGITRITITAIGAAGGACDGGSGGEGASVTATVALSPGEQLFVGVGGQGADGCNSGAGAAGGTGGGGDGGDGGEGGGGGGGLSTVSTGFPNFGLAPLVVAAGGGGAAGNSGSLWAGGR